MNIWPRFLQAASISSRCVFVDDECVLDVSALAYFVAFTQTAPVSTENNSTDFAINNSRNSAHETANEIYKAFEIYVCKTLLNTKYLCGNKPKP